MQRITCDEIAQDIPGIVILSHGPLAAAILESAEFIVGKVENADAFCLEQNDSTKEFQEQFLHAISKYPQGTVVFTDILGGTPSNLLLTSAAEIQNSFCVFAGVNLPLLLNAILSRTGKGIAELANFLEGESVKAICNLSDFFEEADSRVEAL